MSVFRAIRSILAIDMVVNNQHIAILVEFLAVMLTLRSALDPPSQGFDRLGSLYLGDCANYLCHEIDSFSSH